MVLTHLILNDMVKVKGQISELASCVVDHDSRIANLSKLFFSELSKKVSLKSSCLLLTLPQVNHDSNLLCPLYQLIIGNKIN